ncbi:MAG: 30S ribosomal protein S16 [Flavobacteriaceae bacterium]|nr:30S ribosomal protein S16 [Flavobacteriaceae bacterium]
MSVKIRLQRHGKKGKPFYWVVAADARSKRDGRYLEKIGTYNPNTNPATVNINIDRAVNWLQNGAQPTDTARNLLSETGALLKNHLVSGVRKGAHTEEDVETKFTAWVAEKASRNDVKIDALAKSKADEKAKVLAAEKEVSEKRKVDAQAAIDTAAAEAAAAEAQAEEAAAAEAQAEEAPGAEETTEAVAEEAPAAEETTEAVVEEAPAAEEATEAVAEEAPAAEETTEEDSEKAAE